MFLGEEEILKRLEKSELIVEPILDKSQIGPFTIGLRLGTQFLQSSTLPLVQKKTYDPIEPISISDYLGNNQAITVELGEHLLIQPHSNILGVTLEIIQTPLDLATLVFPRSSWERLGLTVVPSLVFPGFRGKLTLSFHNLGDIPIIFYPGIRIIELMFAEIKSSGSHKHVNKFFGGVTPQLSKLHLDPDLDKIKATIAENQKELKSSSILSTDLNKIITKVLQTTGIEKGKALEMLATEIFKSINGLKVLKTNARLKAEELDVVLKNDITIGFWRFIGSPIVVECKNWSNKVGAKEISILFDKLVSIGPNARMGILIAPNGVTGDKHSDAILKIREKRQQGRDIIVLDRDDLEEIASGVHPSIVIEKKHDQLYLI